MHTSYYKRPLLLLLVLYILGLVLFYTPHPHRQDVFYHISAQPVTLVGKVVGFATVKKKSQNVVIKVQQVNGQKARGYVYARFTQDLPRWHETVELEGKLKKPYSVALLGNLDWKAYLATKNIFTEMQVTSVKPLSPPAWFFRAIAAVRADILQTFEQHFSRSLSAIAGGVLLGERGEIDPQLYNSFQDSGAIHLLVASGGNVGFVTLVVFAFCALFGFGRRKTVLCALVIAGVYTLIAGADAPLTRAYFMTVCAVVGYFLHRNSGVFQGLVLSCFVILLFHPAAVFETGFQMSFLATLAIIICLNNYALPYKWPRWLQFFVQIFLATLSTQLILLPVFTNVFFKVSFVGLLSNMILVPLASVLMAVSFLFYLFSCLHLGFVLQPLTGGLLWCFEKLVEFFASLPFASWQASAWRTGWIVCYYTGLFMLFHLPEKTFLKKTYKPLLGLMAVALGWQYLFCNAPTVWLLNEWNKNAILFRAPNGVRILAGADIEADKLVRSVLKSGGRKIDLLILNEYTDKQLENVQKLQTQMPVGQVLVPFENIWPGEEIAFPKGKLRARWGILLNRKKQTWINEGYAGSQDNVSYHITYKDLSFTTAGNNRFIELDGRILDNIQNGTRRVNL